MAAAGNNYQGEQTPQAVFQSLFLPAAQEAGFSISYDDVENMLQDKQAPANMEPLDLDEMQQVSGGEAHVGGGLGGVIKCDWVGAGLGGTAGKGQGALCIVLGVGFGSGVCLAVGGTDEEKEFREQEEQRRLLEHFR